ncbi:MAG: YlmC/YmxH family sporulation protein [Acutalibacteraceae bacterium]|nr:YlmC/YmxH family sporulation protein [Acutalibacteraceae bacterium]
MTCRIDELRNKQVVCVDNGGVLGFVSDIELDTANGSLTSVIIFGRLRFFGLLGREEDIIIPWQDICVIGNETILVRTDCSKFPQKR